MEGVINARLWRPCRTASRTLPCRYGFRCTKRTCSTDLRIKGPQLLRAFRGRAKRVGKAQVTDRYFVHGLVRETPEEFAAGVV